MVKMLKLFHSSNNYFMAEPYQPQQLLYGWNNNLMAEPQQLFYHSVI